MYVSIELIEIFTNDFEFVNVLFNKFSKKLYAVTQEKIESENAVRTEYNLVLIRNNKVIPQYRIGHEVEGIFMADSLNVMCLSCVNYANYPASIRKIFFYMEIAIF